MPKLMARLKKVFHIFKRDIDLKFSVSVKTNGKKMCLACYDIYNIVILYCYIMWYAHSI